MKGLVTVFGGSGFLGRQIVRALAKDGYRIRVAARQTARAYEMRLYGDVGQVEIVQANIRNPASVARAVAGAEAVVNAIGILHETGRQRFLSVQAMGARTVAEAAKAAGVTRLIQISALGADANSASRYYVSKAEGEAAVREVLPTAVILRPSVIFGPEDTLFNRFARMAQILPALPLIGGGACRFQPVYVTDVARAAVAALGDPAAAGRTYELGGPAVHTLRQLYEITLKETMRHAFLAPLPFPIASLIGLGGDLFAAVLPFAPPITSDQVRMMKSDCVVSAGALGLADLGITPTPLEPILPTYLYSYRKGGQYAEQFEPA